MDAPGGVETQSMSSERPITADDGDRGALRELLAIAAPSVVTMSSYTVMQFVDKLMVSRIGPEPIYVAAQGNAGIVTWTLMTFSVGVAGVVNSFVSQNLGAGKPERGAAYAWNGMFLGLAWWLAIMLPAALLIPCFYGLDMFDQAGDAVRVLQTEYAQIAIAGGVFTLMAKPMHNYFFGMHKPVVVAVCVILGNAVNVFANWVLIFGHLGAPEMGLSGAALGTVIGTVFEFALPLVIFLGVKYNTLYGTRGAWRPNKVCIKDLLRIGWPAGVMFVNDLICWAILMVVLIPGAGKARALAQGLGEEAAEASATIANSAGYIALQFMHLSFMPAVGISIATQAVVGKAIGQGRTDRAHERAMLGLKLGMVYMGVCAIVFFVFREEGIAVFVDESTSPEDRAELIRVGAVLMIGAAVFQVFDAVAIVLSAALRGAGDTVWPGVASIVLSWSCVVGVGYLLIEVAPGLGVIGPWIGASGFIVLLAIVLWLRYAGGKWRTMKLTHDDPIHNLPPDENIPGPGPEQL